jgi:nucleotide-binding universal stress UspA family protein
MSYKDILVLADEADTAATRLDVAATVAAAQKAHLAALHVMEKPYTPAAISRAMPSAVLEWQESLMRERAEAAKKAVDAAQRRSGADIEWRLVRGETIPAALLHSRYADLVVTSQTASEDDTGDLMAEELVMGSGRPVLVVPRYGKFQTVGERVLIAWNRTRESTRAVHDAMPFLTKAKSVRIMEVNPDRDDKHIAGADIAVHLARHGVNAEVGATTAEDIRAGDVLLSRAADLGADLLVMGAYGHSRLREYTFGGVTLHLLQHMTIPVLLSH